MISYAGSIGDLCVANLASRIMRYFNSLQVSDNPSGALLSFLRRDIVDTDLNYNRWVFIQVFDPHLTVLGTMNFLRRLTFERPQKELAVKQSTD